MATDTAYSNSALEDQIDQFPSEENNLSINLNAQKLTDQDMEIIVRHAIEKRQCTSLDLQDNEFTAEGMSILVPALNNNTKLHTLHLHGNRLLDKGIYSLVQTLMSNNQTLRILGLNSIGLTDVGAEDLGVVLQKNHTLTHLQLQGNQIGDRGVLYLSDALAKHNTTLEQLEIAENKNITDESVDNLVEMIQCNRSLKLFDIKLSSISDQGKTKLQEAAESNKDLQFIL